MADTEESIRVARRAIDMAPKGHPDRAMYLNNLGVQLGDRYIQTGAMANLEEAIRVTREAIELTPKGRAQRAGQLHNLGIRLYDRYSSTGKVTDLEEAITVARQAVDGTPNDHPNWAMYMNNLGARLSNKYSRIGALADLDEATEITRLAVDATPETHPDWAGHVNNLGNRLGDRYLKTRAVADLEEAIRLAWQALNATADDHPNRAGWLNNLAMRLRYRYLRMNTGADLDEAIRIARKAVMLTPKGHTSRPTRLNRLAIGLGDWYLRTGDIASLEEAIRATRQAIEATPMSHPDRALLLQHLGIRLGDKYSRMGNTADLDESIEVARQAVNLTPRNHRLWAGQLNNYGNRLGNRYLRTGALLDLEEAIRSMRQAVNATPEDHPDYPGRLNNLGLRLSNKYSRTRLIVYLEEAIQVTRQAINIAADDNPIQSRLLNNLGAHLRRKYLRTEAIVDIEEAVTVATEAVSKTRRDDLRLAAHLHSLGVCLSERYSTTLADSDLEDAIDAATKAVSAIHVDHPDRAQLLNSLGMGFSNRYSKTKNMGDLQQAIACRRSALRQSSSPVITRIQAGAAALRYCVTASDWLQAYEVSEIAVHLIPKLTSRSLESSDKQHVLRQVVGLACDAAAVALQAGKGAFAALEFLEIGRGVLATSLEDMRVDVLDLRERHPDLAEQFIRLRDELELPHAHEGPFLEGDHGTSWQAQTNRRFTADSDFEKLVIEIRKQPGFEDFLLAPDGQAMQAAAKFGPVVVINTSKYRCDAILVEQHQVRVLSLPDLKSNDVEDKARKGNLGSLEALEWLWNVAASPILDALGFIQTPSADDWPHVWWICTGSLCKFPCHAAGQHNSSSTVTVLDRVMSSYSQSIKSIIHGRQRCVTELARPQALFVGMRETPGHRLLPCAELEIKALRDLCRQIDLDIVEPRRHKQDIVAHLSHCKVFHFAGHGHSDSLDPLRSCLFLEDWEKDRLTVATLLSMNLRSHSPFLAYLSACGTGQIKDDGSIDESIHLISACQLAGFRHVIGTLWEVDDEFCVHMAEITYKWMSCNGLLDDSVCRGLHKATRELRERWLSTNTKVRHGRKHPETVRLLAEGGEPSAANGEHKDENTLRDVISCDDEVETMYRLPWVPYVHFGV